MGMTVNNIAPGMVLTPFNQKAIDGPDFREEQVQSIPLKRAAQPEEIGRLAVFLASSDTRQLAALAETRETTTQCSTSRPTRTDLPRGAAGLRS
jgi:glucose 1-dehydrogenase